MSDDDLLAAGFVRVEDGAFLAPPTAPTQAGAVPSRTCLYPDDGGPLRAAHSASGTTTIYDVLADATVVGRIMKVHAAPEGSPWMWTLAFGQHEDPTPTHGYAATREAAMAAFAKSWRREYF